MSDDRRQQAWRLHVQQGMPVRAIAETLGVPVGTVKTWLHRERKARETESTETGPTETGSTEPRGAETAPRQVALAPPPPDRWGWSYISLIPGGAFARWVPCPRCNRPWPNPAWNERDAGRRLVVGELPGEGEPRDRLSLYLLCRSCAEAGRMGGITFRQVVPIWKCGECVDCRRSRYGTAIFEFVDCSDGRMRCLEHAAKWWCHAGQVDPSETPKECADCKRTENLYWSEDGRVRCAGCRLRVWRQAREGHDAPGRGVPLGL
jgi:hypothetical protein